MYTLEELKQILINLKNQKYQLEYSDDYCDLNGKMAKLDEQIFEVKKQIEKLEKENDRKSKNY